MNSEVAASKEETSLIEESNAAPKPNEKTLDDEYPVALDPFFELEDNTANTDGDNEQIVFAKHAKLFVCGESHLNKGTGQKQWLDRGFGELRIHKRNERSRVVMHHELTMKLIANHVICSGVNMEVHPKSDKYLLWKVVDFANGESKETVFLAQFDDKDTANEFKESFLKAQQEVKRLLEASEEAKGDEKAREEPSAAPFKCNVELKVHTETKTGEEMKEVLLSARSALFIDGKNFVVELQLLKLQDQNHLCLLMHQGKSVTMIADHVVDLEIVQEVCAASKEEAEVAATALESLTTKDDDAGAEKED